MLARLIILLSFTAFVWAKPKVSIITSIFKGDAYIEHFLADITRQTIFNQCELILINANSPGKEELVIRPYLKKYPNIIYIKLAQDPGLYGVWNIGIARATADFITNANLDDCRKPTCLAEHAEFLEKNSTIDVVFSNYYVTNKSHESFEKNTHFMIGSPHEVGVDTYSIYECGFGPQPMWRKSLHARYGYFDEQFAIAGDWEFAIRILLKGARFKKIPGISGVYYNNPAGLSTAQDNKRVIKQNKEHEHIIKKYAHAWQRKFSR
jgi:glycosyltransferase involved in cell wall biosynthesis